MTTLEKGGERVLKYLYGGAEMGISDWRFCGPTMSARAQEIESASSSSNFLWIHFHASVLYVEASRRGLKIQCSNGDVLSGNGGYHLRPILHRSYAALAPFESLGSSIQLAFYKDSLAHI